MSENAANVVLDSRTTATGDPLMFNVTTPPTLASDGLPAIEIVVAETLDGAVIESAPHAASANAAIAAALCFKNVNRSTDDSAAPSAHAAHDDTAVSVAIRGTSFIIDSSQQRGLPSKTLYTTHSFQSHIMAVPIVAIPIEPSAMFR
jgi:hypothetical protein